ncbi:MAG: T9SS type A sorting domain-containing protein, partial [Bacteroidales bacterium]|nr:T9SS type A sorting domain-containing protein [Bacteroidales bacterium]
GVYTVEVYDNAGRMLDQASLSATAGEVYPIAIDGESGIYFIKVKGEGGLLKVMKVAKK